MQHYDLYTSLGVDRSEDSRGLVAELQQRIIDGRTDNLGGEEELRTALAIFGNVEKRRLYDRNISDPAAPEVTVDAIRELAALDEVPRTGASATQELIDDLVHPGRITNGRSTPAAIIDTPPQEWREAYRAQQYAYATAPKQSRGSGTIAAVVTTLVALTTVGAGLAAAWAFGLFDSLRGGDPTAQSDVTLTRTIEQTQGQTEPDRQSNLEPQQQGRPTVNPVPASAIPANAAAWNGDPTGTFDSVWRGTEVTSEPFANAVRNAFVDHYRSTGRTNGTLRVYSSVTGQNYDATCRDTGSYITCTGGNNAVVHIT